VYETHIKEEVTMQKEVATKAKEAAAETVKAAEGKAKETAKKAETTVAKKATAAKTTAKKTVAKAAAKTVASKTEIAVQYQNQEVSLDKVEENVKAQFVSEGHKAGSIKTIKIYVKPEEYSAYYVINGKFSGRVDLF
jgi:hypothetical protein